MTSAKTDEQLLDVRGLTKRFGGVTAVDGVSLRVSEGEIFGLIGANGAGKTTLFNLITGFVPSSAGRVLLDGYDISRGSPVRRTRLGLARTFQAPQLFGEMSVRDNLLSGTYAAQLRPKPFGRGTFRSVEDAEARYRWALELLDLDRLEDTLAGDLPYGIARKLEIGRALMTNPRLLMLDEPAAGLLPSEAEALIGIIRSIRDRGHTVLLIEHNMRVVMDTCATIAVLEFGKLIATGTPAEISRNPEVMRVYLGDVA
jgi:branched-chain amino acid transport system ATP-binding protein